MRAAAVRLELLPAEVEVEALLGGGSIFRRLLPMAELLSIDADEISDRGCVSQLATLERRGGQVERLHRSEPPEDVILI